MKKSKYYHSNIEVKENLFKKYKLNNSENLSYYINEFNKSLDINRKYEISNYLPNDFFPICRICNKKIINSNSKIDYNKYDNTLQIITPKIYERIIENNTYKISCCENCIKKHFNNKLPKSPKYYYMKNNIYGAFAYNIPYDTYKKIASCLYGITLEHFIKKYGEDEGKIRWKQYCDKQSYTNTYEYKKIKHNMSKEEFDLFNKSRSVTLDNLIRRHGIEDGNKIWNNYVKQQKYTKSQEYLIKKYGVEGAQKINKSKSTDLEHFILRHGKDKGEKLYKEYLEKHHIFYSKKSQRFFNELDKYLSLKYTTYYHDKNCEYGINLFNKKYIFLDYFIKELNLCIEFNGTVFHADPTIYKENDHPNPFQKEITAKEIWKNDEQRYNDLKKVRNINTIVVWEREFTKNFDFEHFIKDKLYINI